MSQKNNSLELYIAEKFKKIDKYARPTRGSGSKNEIGDILTKDFYVECKQVLTKDNVILRRSVWINFLSKLPITFKTPIVALENKKREKFIVMKAEDFFSLLREE